MIESDIYDIQDEINNSQPISLPSSNTSEIVEIENITPNQRRPPKFTGQRGNLRSKEEIDPKYQHIFTYPYFNEVQSRVIDDTLYSDKSMVICAPTGSGKTVIFEMAIVQLLMELEDKNYTDDFKIIYMAPVKALCTERLTEWYSKFTKLGHLCIEVTGDTDVEFPQLKPYRIIITTPEKWDMLTRRWKDHRSLVEVIKLFLIDEVHILNDEIRGPVLEAVVSRMKTIELSVQSTQRIEHLLAQKESNSINTNTLKDSNLSVSPIRIRFIAVSATVSNPQDVADWLGTSKKPAVYHKFGDECRPVKLKRVVEGYPCPAGTSIFKFDIVLNYKLWNIIQKYHNGKPTLIFCNTRKSVMLTAETLSREITVSFNIEQRNKLMALASTIKTKKIQSLVLCGVGCHHAGLLFEERMNIEQAFRNRDLPILITTTTLAMGVNLPAHLVIIKNTQQYVNGAYQEYSISTILQMVGRAGRPQYDSEATAVIMTRSQDKARYQSLVEGSEPLQSYLHKRLAENLNSEAALCTVRDVAQCVQWLNSTFLSVRAARDPKRYLGLPHAAPAQLISKKIEELCVKAMNGLATAGLISMDEACCIESTEAGRLMSIYYLDLETMKLIMKLEGGESLERLLRLICESHELSDMHLRVDERRCLNSLNRNSAAATIRFPMKGKISSRQMKLSCVIQAVLGCLTIPDPSLNQESLKIMRIADRVCKCLVYYVTRPNFISKHPKFYTTILNSITLAKCVYARLWENSPYVSRQLKGIGPVFSTLLASTGKVKFLLLEESHPRDLERIMNKGPPIGNIIRRQVSLLPKYRLTTIPVDEKTVQIQLLLLNQAHLSENMDHLTAGVNHKCYIIAGDTENYLLYLNSFKESDLINVYDGCITFSITRRHSTEHEILVHCISSTYVGIDEHCKYLFKDINPISRTNVPIDGNLLNKTPSNTDEDILKKRKRKTKDSSITNCNEKKKRDFKFVEKFNNLKESFGQTSKDIKLDIDKATELSNKILQNLEPEQIINNNSTSNTEFETIESLSDSFENVFAEDLNDDDFVDDDKVSDILNEIENEIKSDKNLVSISKEILPNNTFPSYIQKKNIPSTCSAKRRNITTKNNYNFIDKLETEVHTNNDDNSPDICKETGFNNAIKCHIEKYLQKAQDCSPTVDLRDFVEPEKSCNTHDELNKLNIDDNPKKSHDLDKAILNNTIIGQTKQENNEIDKNNESIINILPLHTVNSTEVTCLPESANISKTIKAEQNHLINKPNIYCKNKVNTLQRSNVYRSDVTSIDNKCKGTIMNDERALIGYPLSLQNANTNKFLNNTSQKELQKSEKGYHCGNFSDHNIDAYNREINQIALVDNKTYIKNNTNSTSLKNLAIKPYTSSENEIKTSQSFELCPTITTTIDNEYEGTVIKDERALTGITNLPLQNLNVNKILNNKSQIEWQKQNSKINNISDNIIVHNMDTYKGDANLNTLLHNITHEQSNTQSTSPNRENFKYTTNYKASQSKLFNIMTENDEQKVQIIGKLKIDLDVTKIVHKNETQTNIDPSIYKRDIKTISYNPYTNSSYDSKKLMIISDCTKKLQPNIITAEKNDLDEPKINKNITLPVNNEPVKGNLTIKDILQKYNINARSSNKEEVHINKQINTQKDVKDTAETTKINRRKLRIKDIDKVQIDLPPSLIGESQNSSRNNYYKPETKEIEEQPDLTQNYQNQDIYINNDINFINDTSLINDTNFVNDNDLIKNIDVINDIDLPSPDLTTELTDDNAEFDIDTAILNPKALLQSMHREDEIIPPPIEFCDNDIYSPVHISPQENKFEEDLATYDINTEDTYDFEEHDNIFLENNDIELTPSKEIETWSPPASRGIISPYSSPGHSFTIMRKNCTVTSNVAFPNTRRDKLSYFKFKRKSMLRK